MLEKLPENEEHSIDFNRKILESRVCTNKRIAPQRQQVVKSRKPSLSKGEATELSDQIISS